VESFEIEKMDTSNLIQEYLCLEYSLYESRTSVFLDERAFLNEYVFTQPYSRLLETAYSDQSANYTSISLSIDGYDEISF
jgi:hypothetical protein